MRENLYYDDPLGEIYAVWDEDSIPDIEPFDDTPGSTMRQGNTLNIHLRNGEGGVKSIWPQSRKEKC